MRPAPDLHMATLGPRVVSHARNWIGTPYVHQSALRGAGCDCLGLIRGLWRDIIGTEPAAIPPYGPDWSEPQGEERLWQAALAHLQASRSQDDALGQVLLFRMRTDAVAKHLGVLSCASGGAKFIHAYSGRGVVESALTAPWRRRIVARFDWPAARADQTANIKQR
jgi:NlpC/P60 family putative phage cell wall peptidase